MNQRPLFWLAIASSLGIACSFSVGPIVWLISFAIGLILCLFRKETLFGLFLITASSFGFYTQARIASIEFNHIHQIIQREKYDLKTTFFECEGNVVSMPVEKISLSGRRRTEFELQLTRVQIDNKVHAAQGKIIICLRDSPPSPISYRDHLRFKSKLTIPFGAENEGQFDYRKWLAKKNIGYVCYPQIKSVEILAKREGNLFQWLASHAREKMLATMRLPFFLNPPDSIHLFGWKMPLQTNEQISVLMAAMFLGYSSQMDEELEQAFRNTGTLHLFAISGQNVAAIAAILIWTLEMAGVVRWRWGWVLIPFILIFCLAAGMSAGAARTFVMVSLTYIGWKIYRPIDPLNILGTAVLIVLTIDPNQLTEIGFQLSYGIVIILLLFTAPFTRWLYHFYEIDPWIPKRLVPKWRSYIDSCYRLFCTVWSVSIVAWLGSLPLIFFYFHQCTPIAPLANVCIAPLATLIVLGCTLSASLGWIWHGFSALINQIIWVLVQIMVAIVLLLSKMPGGHFYMGLKPWLSPVSERIVIVSTGEASPMILNADRKYWLIDTGSKAQALGVVTAIQRYWGINSWQGVILTQPSPRHTGGVLEFSKWNSVERYVESGFKPYSKNYENWLRWINEAQIAREFWRSDDSFKLHKLNRKLQVEVLWPPESATRSEQGGMLLRFHIGETEAASSRTILWARSVPNYVCDKILKQNKNVRSDILIQTSSKNISKEWLQSVRPTYWVHPISIKNPIQPWIEQFVKESNIQLIDLRKTGGVIFEMKDDELNARTFFHSAKKN